LCGLLGNEGEWIDSAAAPAAFGGRAVPQTRLRERQARTRLLNTVLKHHGVSVKDWSGNSYLLTSRTGRTAIANTVGEIWVAVERIGGRACDPLDEDYLHALDDRRR
jgi:hypothetical protein